MISSDLKTLSTRASETGSALVYILIAIALLAALTVSFMEPSSQQTSSQNTFKTVAALQGQVDTVRAAIQECILLYPQGDTTIVVAGYNDPYPLDPDSTHLDASYRATAGDKSVSEIRCPGHNDGTANQHLKLFTGSGGKFLPPPPDLFEPWEYYNGPDGVFYWTRTDKSDAFVASALEKLDEKFSECEADIVDTSFPAAGDKALDSAGTPVNDCPNGSLCFRVWLIQNGSAVFNGDRGTDESAC